MAIFDELKSIGKVLQEAGKIEQYRQILETQEKLLEMQKKINELEEENKNLKEKVKIKEDLIFEKNIYWLKNEDGVREGPFCACCWDSDEKLIHLNHYENSNTLQCPKCRNYPKTGASLHVYKPESYNRGR